MKAMLLYLNEFLCVFLVGIQLQRRRQHLRALHSRTGPPVPVALVQAQTGRYERRPRVYVQLRLDVESKHFTDNRFVRSGGEL